MTQETRFENVDMIFEGRLRGNQLMLSSKGLTADEARLLWQSPRMEEISWLDLDDNQLGDEGIQDLVNCPLLGNIQYLNLNKNGISDQGLETLANAKFLGKLKRLHLKENPIAGQGLVALFNSETLDSLSTFQINDGWTCKKREGWRYKPQA
jgi:Ran GTPase-activating protein (RanGAP) involved in mRNA processing and transport